MSGTGTCQRQPSIGGRVRCRPATGHRSVADGPMPHFDPSRCRRCASKSSSDTIRRSLSPVTYLTTAGPRHFPLLGQQHLRGSFTMRFQARAAVAAHPSSVWPLSAVWSCRPASFELVQQRADRFAEFLACNSPCRYVDPVRRDQPAEVYGIAVSRKGSQWTCSRTRRWFGTCSR